MSSSATNKMFTAYVFLYSLNSSSLVYEKLTTIESKDEKLCKLLSSFLIYEWKESGV